MKHFSLSCPLCSDFRNIGGLLVSYSRLMSFLLLLLWLPLQVLAQEAADTGRVITGKVTSAEDGQGMPGVNVAIKGTTKGTTTDTDGSFRLEAGANETLVFSFIGFTAQEVAVGNQKSIDVTLNPDVNELEEVVVVGYGTTKKSDLTGSVVSVRGEDLTQIPVTNAMEVLQGKVPGLDLTRTSGQAGAGLNFTLRGNRSLGGANQPLVIVDGIPYGDPIGGSPDFVDVNPNDIASVEVLKDAAATAIYGSRGANGVILITTKRGVAGKTKISVNSYAGIQTTPAYDHIMDGNEWVALKREAYRAIGQWNSPEDDNVGMFRAPMQLENYRNGIMTNWAEEVLKDYGSQQNHQVSVSGGGEKSNYYLSMEYFNEQGMLRNDELKRYSGRLAINYSILKNLKLNTNINYTVRDWDRRRDPLNMANKISPLGSAYDDEGNFILTPVGDLNAISPLADEQPGAYKNNTRSNRFFGNLGLEWNIVKNLTFTSRLGIDLIDSRQGIFAGSNTIDAGVGGQSIGQAYLNNTRRLTWENFATYAMNIGDAHDIQLTAGTSTIKTANESYGIEGRDLLSPTMLYHNLGALQTAILPSSGLVERQMASFFGRVNYKLFNKYLFSAVLRSDGASVLAPGNKWDFFPAASAAWLLKEENFLKDVNTLSQLKLRASYGISGNSAIPPYRTQGGLNKSTYAWDKGTAELGAFGYYPSLPPAPGLRWEKTASTNIGMDFGFWRDRITGTVDLYQQDTYDILMQRNIPSSSGYSRIWDNVAETRNRGIEVLVSSNNISLPNSFKWTTDLTFTSNREQIMKLSSGDRDIANSWFVGQPINSFYDYQKVGIWQLDEEEAAKSFGQAPGQIKVKDQNGDDKITVEDRVVLGSAVPSWTGGINNRFSFKGIDLTVFVFARMGSMIASEAAGAYQSQGLENGPRVDYWTPENPTNAYPRPNANVSRTATLYYSTLKYVDGSFLKIRDITLGYALPKSITGRASLSRVRVYATAKNYFVFSKLGSYDPERGGALSFPMTRQMVFGINIDL
jgi:TonB-linked SusC/RagA family outer membrane protein